MKETKSLINKSKTAGILVMLFSITSIYAGEVVKLGVKGGGGIQFLWGIEEKKPESSVELGLGGGALLRIKPWEVFGIQLEVNYIEKGGSITQSEFNAAFTNEFPDVSGGTAQGPDTADLGKTLKVEASYVQIPLLFKLFAPGYTVNSPNMFLGPYYGYLLEGKSTSSLTITKGTTINSPSKSVSDLNSLKSPGNGVINQHDFGIVLGLGIDFGMGTFDIRIDQALQTLYESGWDYRTFAMTANIGFLF